MSFTNSDFLLIIILLLTSCGSGKGELARKERNEDHWLDNISAYIDTLDLREDPPDAVVFEVDEPADSSPTSPNSANEVVVSIRKTPCFGRCPVFEMRVYANGRAVYNGQRFVERMGVYEAEVPSSALDELYRRIEQTRFSGFSNQYPANGRRIPDMPSTITYVNTLSVEKKISNNHDAPADLLDFEAFLLEWLEGLSWGAVYKD